MTDEKKTQKQNPDEEKTSLVTGEEKGDDMNTRPYFRNAAEIGKYVDVAPRRVPELVRREGLPARKIRGKWKANICDVREWVINHVRGN